VFIDGFNLYHALDDLGQRHLKWLNLRALCEHFAPRPDHEVREIYYFSAYATWRPAAFKRHRVYVKALQAVGVTPVLGSFKAKDRNCRRCNNVWKDHEEKETDVNIAIYLLLGAFNDTFDRALLVSGDSDLVPAVSALREGFPAKDVRVVAPIGRGHSMDLYRAAGGSKHCRRMKRLHVERSLFGREVRDESDLVVATRPGRYDPPAT
jgi:uncharacterized LabA/DUF88 family protein